jgi:hypothetical protein
LITIPIGPIRIEKASDVDVEMNLWSVNLTGRYEVLETDFSHVALVAADRFALKKPYRVPMPYGMWLSALRASISYMINGR